MTNNTCSGCQNLARVSPNLKCNKHRVRSMSADLVLRAQAAGHDVADSDWRTAEAALQTRKVYVA